MNNKYVDVAHMRFPRNRAKTLLLVRFPVIVSLKALNRPVYTHKARESHRKLTKIAELSGFKGFF